MNAENINDRLVLDYESVCEDVENIIGEINIMRSSKMFSKVLGDDFVKKTKANCASIKKRLRDTFNVVVVGDFKRGKSTLINAIVGANVAPAAVTPETVTINKISYSETPNVEAVLKNGRRATLSQDELKRAALEKLSAQLPSEIEYIDVGINMDVLKEITIIDTPGLGDVLAAFDQKTTDYLTNADALIYVTSVRAPLSMSERAFLSAAVMPQGFARVLLAVNMADTMETPENLNKITEYTKERALEINPDIHVYALSALDELCRKTGKKRPEPELAQILEDNFLEFETAINNDIILQKDLIKSSRVIALARIMIDDISGRIKLIKNALAANSEKLFSDEEDFKSKNSELVKKTEERKNKLANDIDGMKQEAKIWMTEFMARLKDGIRAIMNAAEVSDLERHFQFFMSDQIKSAIVACVEQHQKDISNKMSYITQTMAGEITENAFGKIDTKVAVNITDISWTSFDSAMAWGNFLGGFFIIEDERGNPKSILTEALQIGGVICGFLRQSKVSKMQSDFLNPVLQEFDSITNDVIKNTEDVYEKLKLAAVDKIETVFQSQVETSVNATSRAKQIFADESIQSKDAEEYLDSILTELSAQRETLEKYDV